ncbi:MAG: hypothetical protein ISQ32_02885 [Rickettsiales bacterium]|nr:hypothetical protein [Rickettsiales bacterium]
MKDIIILGLHFGHDACMTILKNGEIVANIERERLTKNKHSAALNINNIKEFLNDNNMQA